MSGLFKKFAGRASAAAAIPAGRCVYAVGDIHGRHDLLVKLLERIWADAGAEANTLVFLGDYVDRGPDSKKVVECLSTLSRPGWEIVALRGNHEQLLLDFCVKPEVYQGWRSFGGAETLVSYGVQPPRFANAAEFAKARDAFVDKLPPAHRDFLSSLPCAHTVGDYFFVHAGVRPGVPLERQAPEDMLWIRDLFLSSDARLDKKIVHGHSPEKEPVFRPNRIGIDTGAYATDRLTAVKLLGQSCTILTTAGRALS